MRILAIVFVLVGGVALLGGIVNLSNATSGVGGIAIACFFGILARLAQASAHHADVAKWMTRAPAPPVAASTPHAAVTEDRLPPIPNQMR